MVAPGLNAPVPVVVQVPPVAQPPTEPLKATQLVPQIVWSPPALAVGGVIRVSITCAVAAGHGAHGPVEVSVSVTPPFCTSATDGQYRALSAVSPGVNVPVPEDVHWPPVAQPPTDPFRAMQLVPQLVWLVPASAVGGVITVSTACVEVCDGHAPLTIT